MRNGLLGALALLLSNSAVQAQYYWPAQRPYGYAPPTAPAVMVAPPNAGYYAPRAVYPTPYPAPYPAGPNYLPQGYFPGAMAPAGTPVGMPVGMPVPAIVRDGAATPVPSEPNPNAATVTASDATPPGGVPTAPVQEVNPGAGLRFSMMPQPANVVEAPTEPIPFHRACTDRCYLGADYRLGWINRGPLGVPLVTTGTVSDESSGFVPGALGSPSTVALFGQNKLDFRMLNGLNLEAGYFFDCDNHFSADVSGFYFLPQHVRFGIASDTNGLPLIARPVFDPSTGSEAVYIVSEPSDAASGLVIGSISVDARTQLWGLEANARYHYYNCGRFHGQALVGFRTVHLDETLSINEVTTPESDTSNFEFRAQPLAAGDTLIINDVFRARNSFYGFQLGGSARWELDRGFLELFGKVALGVTDQQVRIEGTTTLVPLAGGPIQTSPGGVLAVASNMGEHNRQQFGIIPELGVNLGVDLCKHLRFRTSYSLLFWDGVVRPGSHIDRVVNGSQVPSDENFGSGLPAHGRPAFNWHEQSFFAQWLSFGLEFHY